MALILPTAQSPIAPGRSHGNVIYLQGGRLISRGVKVPRNRRTAPQLSERNQIVRASKIWKWILTEQQQIDWRSVSHITNNGSTELQGTASTCFTIDGTAVTTRGAGVSPVNPTVASYAYAPSPFHLELLPAIDIGGPDTMVAYLFTRPDPPSRTAQLRTMRYIGASKITDGVVDLTSAYIDRFRRSPYDAQTLGLVLNACDPAVPGYSTRTSLITITPTVPGITCSIFVSSDINPDFTYSVTGSATNTDLPIGDTVDYTLSALNGLFTAETGFLNNNSGPQSLGGYAPLLGATTDTITADYLFSDLTTCQSVFEWSA